jgi:anti-sigma factor RsiW
MTTPDPSERAAGFDPALSRWLDGEAAPEEARLVEERLAADPALRARVERWRADADLFRADVRPREDAGLADRVLAAVASGVGGGLDDEERFHRAARRWSVAAAVLMAVGVGGSIAIDRVLTPAPDDPETLTSLVESNRLDVEVDLFLDQRPVAPSDR